MKKIALLTLFIVFCITNLSFAERYDPFIGTALEGKPWSEFSSDELYGNSFLVLHQITLDNLNSENAYWAFRGMKYIYKSQKLEKKYNENQIQSQELKQLVGEIIAAKENPQTAKDYYYRALFYTFYYKFDGRRFSSFDYTSGYYQNVIENYPDSVYAEFSYVALAGYYGSEDGLEFKEIEYANAYLAKYGENAKLKANIYSKLANVYDDLFYRVPTLEKNADQKIASMLLYADKLMTEFPDRKGYIGGLVLDLGFYYSRTGNHDKALALYEKVYTDPDNQMREISMSIGAAMRVHIKKKDYNKANAVLDYGETHYSNDVRYRESNKRLRRNLAEVIKFGYDRDDNSPRMQKIYEQKKTEIEAFRTLYEQSWDANFNMIAPLP